MEMAAVPPSASAPSMGDTPLGKTGGATTGDQPPAAGWRSLSIGTAWGHPGADVVFTDVHLYVCYM